MTTKRFDVRQAAVLGAGVMGAQIAALLAASGIPVILYDLPADGADKNAIAKKSFAALKKHQPPPLALPEFANLIKPANYDDDLPKLENCDLVIEAIVERGDWKAALYQRVAPHLGAHSLLLSNTSGLSINQLAENLPENLRSRFCGVHFFNPPRYMTLIELVPNDAFEPERLDDLERFLVTGLGKGVIRAKDTPNFIANRIGVFSMLSALANAERFGLRADVVDDLTGVRLGRAKSATFRTLDVVGLDIFSYAVQTMQQTLFDDPWHEHFKLPDWLLQLISNGALGAKTGIGVYKKDRKQLLVFDPVQGDYVPAGEKCAPEIKEMLKTPDPNERLRQLRASDHPQAQFLWHCLSDLFHYASYHLADVAHNARDVDLAMRWGFGWQTGPFELWQMSDWQTVTSWLQDTIGKDNTLSSAPLPAWVTQPDRHGVHAAQGSYDAEHNTLTARSSLDVYRRQLNPPTLFGEPAPRLGETVFENDGVHVFDSGDDILVASFKSKAHTISPLVIEGLHKALDIAEERFQALVIWHPDAPFSAGADLQALLPTVMSGNWQAVDAAIAQFQQMSLRLRYSRVPVVAAVQGYAFGGGCEFIMHCDRVVAARESYIGLVESGIGLLPAGGGCKEFAWRAARQGGDLLQALIKPFTAVAMAKVSNSAFEAQQIGYLREADCVIANVYELLYVARLQALALAGAGYRPPLPPAPFVVAGRSGAASIKGQLLNQREGHFISEHDFLVTGMIADVITGGDVESGTLVDEAWLLRLEREAFVRLLQHPKSQERIISMLTSGKPVRN